MTDLVELRQAEGAYPAVPAPSRPPYAATDATRLLCAGVYLSDKYRANVINELHIAQYRYVAPSYGYDVVPVLGHALAAHRLRGLQFATTYIALLFVALLVLTGALDPVSAVLLFGWVSWCAAFLARVSTLDVLMRWLRPVQQPGGFDGGYPKSSKLTEQRIAELAEQQYGSRGVVYYGGYKPFVGAGVEGSDWSAAVLLVAERPNPLLALTEDDEDEDDDDDYDDEDDGADELIPFTVQEITDYVADRLHEDLVARPEVNERIEGLVIERRRFAQAIAKSATENIDANVAASQFHWEESYDAAREYLCVRIGAWQQELVTSIFVGFDIRGNTLHMEFHPHVLLPIIGSFHLVDRLPDRIGPRLLWQVGRKTLFSLPREVLGLLLHPLAQRLPDAAIQAKTLDRRRAKAQRKSAAYVDDSYGIAGYAEHRINRGARASVRELAAQDDVQHYFQDSDVTKYREVVERSLLRVIETFLDEHNVDLTDYRSAQSNILYQSIRTGNIDAQGDVKLSQTARARRKPKQ